MLNKTILAFFLSCAMSAAYADTKDERSVRIFRVQMDLAQSGDAAGQYYVGEMYEKGLGTDQDLKLAHAWYTKSAALGNALAKDKLANWERIKQEIATAKEEARARQIALEAAKAEERAAGAARAKQAEAKEKERAAAKQQAAEKERVAKEAKTKQAAPPSTPVAAPVPQPTKVNASAKKQDKTDAEFSANPCKGPSAKFLSTCK